jgi:phosphotransacetylase
MLRKIEETIKSIAQLINQNVCKIVVIKNPSKITGNLKNEKTDIEEVKN